jgi:predicted nucleic acid-binding Zn ribbon protein
MKMSDYDPAKIYYCPYCHAKLARVILAANFQLVGQGWFNSGGY